MAADAAAQAAGCPVSYPAAAGPPPGFPNCRRCPYRTSGPPAICIACALSTVPPLAGERCPICAQRLVGDVCRNTTCRRPADQRGFRRVAAVSVLTSPLAETLRGYKYGGKRGWRFIFGRLLLGWLDRHPRAASRYDLILPNPSHAGREPYQHVELMLEVAAAEDVHRRWPIHPAGLVKTRKTPRSAGGGLEAKIEAARLHAAAVRVAPELRGHLDGARVLLIDDVFTTGAQFAAVGRRLRRRGGVARVDGLVIARTPWRT